MPIREVFKCKSYWREARILTSLSAFCFSFSLRFIILTFNQAVGYLLESVLLVVGEPPHFEDSTEGALPCEGER